MPAPISQTCPDINTIQTSIKTALKLANQGYQECSWPPQGLEILTDIIYELDGLEGKLEDLRKANAALREWGQQMEKEKIELEKDNAVLEETACSLEREFDRYVNK
jgi:hypothetical protein